ncbi:MAG: Gldg family protein [Candidatus Poribacteria bacterium]|nr:Gldg family protein [Candidatus Poribacteria bacterium]MDE0505087.1 Gldg family protein [Candidatus Poribacteria bacterium]
MPSKEKDRARANLAPLLGFLALILLFGALAGFLLGETEALWILLVLGASTLTAFIALNRKMVARFFVSRQARYGANVAISIIFLVGIMAIINIIVDRKFDFTADLTADKLYTLSDQTKNILRGLNREVKVLAFYSNNADNPRMQNQLAFARDVLGRYARETDKLEVEFIDPATNPQSVEVYDIDFDGTVVFESGLKREQVTTVDEQKFTSAIMKVVRDEVKRVYFLIGHEERGIDVYEADGYQGAREALEKQNYAVEPLTLTTEPDVPPDCSALVIAAPRTHLVSHEVDAIARYLDRNGKLLLMFEPSIISAKDPNQQLVELAARWGVSVENDYVLVFDPRFSSMFGGPEAPVIKDLELHEITRYVGFAIFQTARSVTPSDSYSPNLSVKSLAKTIDTAGVCWGETERGADGVFLPEASYTEGVDTPPPLSLAVAVELTDENEASEEESSSRNPADAKPAETRTRLVVFGDSDFASNAYFANTGGGDLFLNAIHWLTLEEDLIAIRPLDPSQRTLRRATASEAGFVQMTSIFLIPIVVFIIGVVVWWRRR